VSILFCCNYFTGIAVDIMKLYNIAQLATALCNIIEIVVVTEVNYLIIQQ